MAANLDGITGFQKSMRAVEDNPVQLDFLVLRSVELAPPHPGSAFRDVTPGSNFVAKFGYSPVIRGKLTIELEIEECGDDVSVERVVGSVALAMSRAGVRVP